MRDVAQEKNSYTPPDGWARCVLSDQEIVALVTGGNEAAFEGIMRRYNRLLFRLARSIVANDQDAEDAVQESYVRAYFKLSQFKGPGGFASWLSRITINEALSRARRKSRVSALDDCGLDADGIAMDARLRPDRMAMSDDILGLIESAVDTLPQDFRLVFMLRAVEELSVQETADILDLNPATVKTRFHRARGLMRKTLTRRLGSAVPQSFYFAGKRCDRIVANTFERISGHDDEA